MLGSLVQFPGDDIVVGAFDDQVFQLADVGNAQLLLEVGVGKKTGLEKESIRGWIRKRKRYILGLAAVETPSLP